MLAEVMIRPQPIRQFPLASQDFVDVIGDIDVGMKQSKSVDQKKKPASAATPLNAAPVKLSVSQHQTSAAKVVNETTISASSSTATLASSAESTKTITTASKTNDSEDDAVWAEFGNKKNFQEMHFC